MPGKIGVGKSTLEGIRDKLRFFRFCQEQYRGTQKAEKLVIVHLLVQNNANQKTEKP